MQKQTSVILAAALMLISASGFAEAPDFGVKIRQDAESSLEDLKLTRLRAEVTTSLTSSLGEAAAVFVEAAGTYEASGDDGALELREAFLSIYLPSSDLVVGRQIINWGTADGLNPTGVLNPLAVDSFVEEQLRWEPVLALRSTTYLGSALDVSGVVILDFVPLQAEGVDAERPEPSLEHLEYAARLNARVGTVDLRSTYFYGWEDLPALILEVDLDPITLQPIPGTESISGSYRREHRLGVAATGELFTVGIWGEAAYVLPERLKASSAAPLRPAFALSPDDPRWETVVGVDYTLPFGLYVEGQYAHYGAGSWLAPYGEPGAEPDATNMVMGRLSFPFGLDNSVQVVGFADVGRRSALFIPSVTVAIAPSASVRIVGIIPVGPEEGLAAAFSTAVRVSAVVEL